MKGLFMFGVGGIKKLFLNREQKGYYEMIRSAEYNDKCFNCEDIVLHDEKLEEDLRRMQSMIVDVDDFYAEIYEKHCDLPDFIFIHQHLGRAVGDPEELLKVLPEE